MPGPEGVLSWDEWLALDVGEPDWLIPGLLERGGGGLVHGSTQSYKSFLMLRMCLDLAAGLSVLDIFPVTAPRPTLLFQAEGSVRAWRRRMLNLRDDYPSGIPFWSRHTAVDMFDSPSGDARMRAALERVRPDLLVLDPIADFFDGSDTDQVSVQRWLRVVNGWKTDFSCAVVLVHHDRQPLRFPSQGKMTVVDGGLEEVRGNTRLIGWPDVVLGMRRKLDVTTVRVQKVRDAEHGQEFDFRLVSGKLVLGGRTDLLAVAILAAVVGEVWQADVMHSVEAGTGMGGRMVRRAIDKLVTSGELVRFTMGGRLKLRLGEKA